MKKTRLLLNIFLFSIGVNMALAQVPSYVPTNGLVGYWPFNGNANDESGNGNNGTVNGATLTTDRFGNANKAYSFDGVNDNILVPYNLSLNPNLPFSVSFFGLTNSPGTSQTWISTNPFGVTKGWVLMPYQGTGMNYEVSINNQWQSFVSPYLFPTSNWVHCVFVFDVSSIKVFINGSLLETVNLPAGSISYGNSLPLMFGSTVTGLNWLNGKIDDIGIHNRVLTQQEITNLYTNTATPTCSITPTSATVCAGDSVTLTASTSATNVSICSGSELPGTLQNGLVGYWPFCGNANDASGNGNNGTVNGATLTTDRFGNANSAYGFDGVDDWIDVAHSASLEIFAAQQSSTISVWIQKINVETARDIISKGVHSDIASLGNKYLAIVNDGIQLGYFLYDFSSMNSVRNSPNSINSNQWYHLVIVRDQNIKLYLNGIDVSSNAVNSGWTTNYNTILNNKKMTFGARNNLDANSNLFLNQFWDGKLDDIAIYNRALTPSEIQQLYIQGQTTYSWSNGATTPSITVAPAATTTCTCTATVNGASGSSTSTVTVNPLPAVNAGADVAICSGNTATLAASGATTYSWNNSVSNGVAFSPAASGTYSVSGTDANGCVNSDDVTVTVNPLPTVNAGSDQTVCAGTSVTLSATGANTFAWDNNVSNGTAFTPTATTTYSVSGTDSNGCSNTDQVLVTVNPLPNVSAGADQSICKGDAVTLSGTGASTYTWNNNVTNGLAFNPIATATYSVAGTDANGCANSDDVVVTVNEASASTLTESALDSYTLNGQTYTQSGTYTQVITNASGCDSTITLNLTLSFTGLNELAQGIQLFPNPANDVLNIQSSSPLSGEYTLYDASGREVLRGVFTGALTKIDVRNIAPGTYTLQAAELMERLVVLR
jgi:hypothetical protein